MRERTRACLVVGCALGVAGCMIPPAASADVSLSPRIDEQLHDELTALADDALAGVDLIVELAAASWRVDGGALADALVLELADGEVSITRAYDALPYVALQVRDQAALSHLLGVPGVVRIYRDEPHETQLTSSLAFVRQPSAVGAGVTGAGTAVAVLDTGVDWRNAAFGTCSAPGSPGCRVAFVADFAADDGALDDNGHGTNIAGLVAGVAPDARILGLDVFRGAQAYSSDILAAIDWVVAHQAEHNIVALNMSFGGGGSSTACSTDVFAAAIRGARAAGVLSSVAAGNNGYTDKILSPACVPEAISVGAVYDTTSSSGVTYSSCSDAAQVADRPTCFSNTAPFLSLLAPGAAITAAGTTMSGTSQATPHVAGALALLGQAFPDDTVETRLSRLLSSGVAVTDPRTGRTFPRLDVGAAVTAAPCWASVTVSPSTFTAAGGSGTATVTTETDCAWTLGSSAPFLTPHATSGTGSGVVTFTVSANGGAARTATLTTSAGAAVPITQQADTTPPTGAVAFANGATLTNTRAVTLALSATDPSGVAQMCLSNSTSCSAWTAYATTASWTLAPAGNTATVRAWFKDMRGNATPTPAVATIAFDATPPTDGTVIATRGDGRVDLSWLGFADGHSGVREYVVVSGATPPPSCASGAVLQRSAATNFAHTGLSNGVAVGYRVCAVDAASNVSVGVTAIVTPVPETDPPSNGSVLIDGGAAATRLTAVTLTIAASDATGVAEMCVSNTTSCSAWTTYATTTTHALSSGSGTRTVRVWFRDRWGNATPTPASDTIVVDTAPPRDGTGGATAGNGTLTLTWSGFSDALSGLGAMKVAVAPTTAPPTCAAGTITTLAASATTATLTGLTNGTAYGARVCAMDVAGNLSRGFTVTAKPVPETNPPQNASVVINGGVPLSRSSTVQLTLAATDDTSVAQVCVSNTAACASFTPFTATRSWTLAGGNGLRTVSVWYRDPWGNTSAPVRASITVDSIAPAGGTVTAIAHSRSVSLSWGGFTDGGSGVVSFRLVAGTTTPTSCNNGTVLSSGAATSFVHTDLTAGITMRYRVCAVDAAGNMGNGVTASGTPKP